ncbi:jg18854 [Pararge aegeria aegeria]|uniref:Jg18854 protein n=1 Tax=Pararge aegeria aegeria TaxID=348720 RepID=A0A8S4QKJ9_9NEOP|nr:jg18854 [Pararge aegeria aegeria]
MLTGSTSLSGGRKPTTDVPRRRSPLLAATFSLASPRCRGYYGLDTTDQTVPPSDPHVVAGGVPTTGKVHHPEQGPGSIPLQGHRGRLLCWNLPRCSKVVRRIVIINFLVAELFWGCTLLISAAKQQCCVPV